MLIESVVVGLRLKAFQTIDAQALIALTLSEQPRFTIPGQATAVFPKSLSPDSISVNPLAGAFLLLDFTLLAVLDPVQRPVPSSFIHHVLSGAALPWPSSCQARIMTVVGS
jgi:hypothetical protein